MTRELWVRPTERAEVVAGAALEAGAAGVLVEKAQEAEVTSVGRLEVGHVDGDTVTLPDGRTGPLVRIGSPQEQDEARALLGTVDLLVVEAADWTIIPLENLIAWAHDTDTALMAVVSDAQEAEVALGTLETGVAGLVLTTGDPATVHATARIATRADGPQLALTEGEVVSIQDAGMGDRVCVDTTSLLRPDEGLLVGSASSFLVLVASEAQEAGYVASRPFRVNAGAVHAYVQAEANRTHYLSEVAAGTRLVVVDADGLARTVTTGRAKVERRPMVLVELQAGDRRGSVVLQNAETIRLLQPDGATVSVADLALGDRVLVHLAHQGGRHFGQAIDETIREV